ncbi:hypothetical protein COCCADRAFT_113365, partial [Bipolaris zeicola 26-R-13]
ACRAFLEKHLLPFALKWEREEKMPDDLFQTLHQLNMLLLNMSASLPIYWLRSLGINDDAGTHIEEGGCLHTDIYLD